MDPKEIPQYTYTWKKSAESDEYEAKCREIPDLAAYGETPQKALEEIRVAVGLWLEVLKEDGLPFPARQPQQESTFESGASRVLVRKPRPRSKLVVSQPQTRNTDSARIALVYG